MYWVDDEADCDGQDWKYAKAETDACVAEFDKFTEFEPGNVPRCERLVLDVARGRNKVCAIISYVYRVSQLTTVRP